MFVQQLSIAILGDVDRVAVSTGMEMLMGSLFQAGLTQGKGPMTYLEADRMVAVVHCMEECSLDAQYYNDYVRQGIDKLESLCGSKLQIRVLGKSSPDYAGPCQCTHREHFVLFTHFLSIGSPLLCGTCDRRVPLYRIPWYQGGNHYSVMTWMSNYHACDTLQIHCEVGERWAMNQMQAVDSALSKQGRKICARIEELTGTPTYYYLFNYRNIPLKVDHRRPCPSCGGPWLLETALHGDYHFMCKPCRLISSETCG